MVYLAPSFFSVSFKIIFKRFLAALIFFKKSAIDILTLSAYFDPMAQFCSIAQWIKAPVCFTPKFGSLHLRGRIHPTEGANVVT